MPRTLLVFFGLALLAAVGGVIWGRAPVWGADLLAAGAAIGGWWVCRGGRRAAPPKSAGQDCDAWGETISSGPAGQKNSYSMTPKVLMRHVDALLERHPGRPDIKLAKAQLLIEINRDIQGARAYCREVIGATRHDDPLFQAALHLHLSTYRPAGRTPCAHQAGGASPSTPCAFPKLRDPHRPDGAKVIVFPNPQLPGF